MKAAIARELGKDLLIEEIPLPKINETQILVKIIAAGVCHTDLHAVSGDWSLKPQVPFIPGHEGAGVVYAVGSKVTQVKEGDRVGVFWLHTACGNCQYCLTGYEMLCPLQKNTGYSVNGCYAEYVIADPNYVAHLPKDLDFCNAAPILCAGLTTYRGIKETQTKPGDWLIISGIGGLGHLAVQYAKAMGLKVIAIDVHEPQLKLAQELNADIVINAAHEDPVKAIRKKFNKGVQGILATAVCKDTFAECANMLCPGGTMVIVGLPPGTFNISIFELVMGHKTIRGSVIGSREDLAECLAFAADGKIRPHYTFEKLENINQVFHKMKMGQVLGRAVIHI